MVRGIPEPRQYSSLPRLQLLQSGGHRDRAESGRTAPRPSLPITPPTLHQMRSTWGPGWEADDIMLWAVSVTCFLRFFRAGEITVPSQPAFDPRVHLAWGDVTWGDGGQHPNWVRFFLKWFLTDQFGRGIAVYSGSTGDDLCQVTALEYVSVRGETQGPFFCFEDGTPLTKDRSCPKCGLP